MERSSQERSLPGDLVMFAANCWAGRAVVGGAALRMREIVYKYWTQVLQWQTHNGEVEPQPGYTTSLTHNSHCYCLA